MPFCSNCGTQVNDDDAFCGKCGAPQSSAGAPRSKPKPGADPLAGISPTVASVLCYLPFLGWLASIFVLASERFRRNRSMRFHAFQGLYLSIAWLIYDWVIESILYTVIPNAWTISRAVRLAYLAASIFLMFKTSQRETVRLPFISDLADQSVNEQR